LEACRFLAASPLYRYRPHVQILRVSIVDR
jgi:hypothetical protein